MDAIKVITSAVDVVAHRLTTEIVGHTDDYNGGRLSGDRANRLAHLAICELLTHGYVLVKLPESRPGEILGQIKWDVDSTDPGAAVTIRHDGRIASDGVSNPYANPLDARSHAAGLLAAADEALGRTFI